MRSPFAKPLRIAATEAPLRLALDVIVGAADQRPAKSRSAHHLRQAAAHVHDALKAMLRESLT